VHFAGTAAIQNAANPNGQQQDVLGAGLEGAESGLYNTAMMAPLGAYHQWGDSGRRSALGRDLNSPLNPVDMFDAARTAVGRDNAAAAIQPEVSGLTSKDKADAWQKGVVDKSLNDLVDTMQAKDRAEYDAVTNAKPEAPKPSVTTTQEQYNQLFGKDSEHAKQSAAAPATTAEQEAADLAAQDAIKAVGIGRKNKQGQEMARQAIALGIDLESADAEKLVRALKSSKFALAQTEIDRLKGGTDGTARPADGGTDAGGVDGRGNAGGDVGAGDVAGSAAAGRGAGAAAGNEAAHGAPVDGAGGERPAAKLKAADIPDFSLTPPSGSPNMNWIAANHEPTTEAKPTRNTSIENLRETGQQPLWLDKPTPKRTVQVQPKTDKAGAAIWDGLKIGPKFKDLDTDTRAAIAKLNEEGNLNADSLRRMAAWRGGHLDAQLFAAFVKCLGIYPLGTLVRLQSERLAVVVGQAAGKPLTQPTVRVFFPSAPAPVSPPACLNCPRRVAMNGLFPRKARNAGACRMWSATGPANPRWHSGGQAWSKSAF